MAMQTREQILETIMRQPIPPCPHCGQVMNIWETPPIDFSDGLGWGVPYLFVCFNNECPPYVAGWDEMADKYAHNVSTRCLVFPGTKTVEYMPVFSELGGLGQIVDEELVQAQEKLNQAIKEGFARLAECYQDKDTAPVLEILLDSSSPNRVRVKAADMLSDIGGVESLDSLINTKFGNQILQETVKKSSTAIMERTFTKECPFCAEIIKKRAKVCKHCSKELN